VLAGKTVILGVSGGIAVHYVPELIGVLRQRHMAAVRVVMTEAATRFIEVAKELPIEVENQRKEA